MKRITTIVLFASIFAVAVGTLGLSGSSATPLMISAAPQTQENVGMLGHVEYKVLDDVGNVKKYMQNDNVVVIAGKDCAAQHLFFNTNGQTNDGTCIANSAAFTYIGIGNGSSGTVNVSNQTLADATDDATGTCSASGGIGTAGGGDMARRNVTATTDVGGTSRVVTLDTSGTPFTFDASNATSVIDSGIFNKDYTGSPVNGQCVGTQTAGTDWNMFSRQLLNGATGISVSSGDSLSVKWTITIG
ncbi:MAG: hypothetical protein ACE5GR_07180 [Nitrosopumilus sp.]